MTSKLTRLTDEELAETLRLATSGYPLPASAEENLRHAFAELQERRKAEMNSEPYGFTDGDRRGMIYEPQYADRLNEPLPVYRHAPPGPVADSQPVAYTDERNLGYIDRGRETAYLWGKQNSDPADVALYRHAQPAPVVPDEMAITEDMNLYQKSFAQGHNACRAAMLQAGNSPTILDDARDALTKALAAMEYMGDTLNNLDAVCTEDAEFVATAFEAVRRVLAAAPQEVK